MHASTVTFSYMSHTYTKRIEFNNKGLSKENIIIIWEENLPKNIGSELAKTTSKIYL